MKSIAMSPLRLVQALLVCSLLLLSTAPARGQRNLKDIPDTDPTKELASFKVADGFKVNLYVSDPDIAKPIQMNFDSRGRLWIASSEVYPHIKPGLPATDKILVVEDRDRNGVADKTTVFADNLLIPTGVLPGDGGAYVVNSTELLHLEDTDGDLRADVRRVVLSGFGSEDTHHLLHTLRWGHDGALYMNQSIYIHSHVETPYGVRRLLGGGIWQFRPESMKLEILCRGFVNPWGHHFDRWGQSFATDGAYGEGINYVFPGAVFVTAPGLKRRLTGLNPGSPKHCGLEILSGRHLPDEWRGTMVTNDFRAHRVCRFSVTEQSSGYASRQEPELITTSHGAFRPIDVKMGPDGAIYIADWYNLIIQHGEVDFRDDRRDHVHGRIWRITAEDRDLSPRVDPAALSIMELLDLLTYPEDWIRLHAKLELKTRNPDKVETTIARWLQRLDSSGSQYIHNRLEGLWAMRSIDRLPLPLIYELCRSSDARARAAALRVVAENTERIPLSFKLLATAVDDEHARVRLEAVRGLASIKTSAAADAVARALDHPVDRFLDFAIWQSLRDLQPFWYPAFSRGEPIFHGNTEHIIFAIRAVDSPDAGQLLVRLIKGVRLEETRQFELMRIVGDIGTADNIGELLHHLTERMSRGSAGQEVVLMIRDLCDASRVRKLVPPPAHDLLAEWKRFEDPVINSTRLGAAGYWRQTAFLPELVQIAKTDITSTHLPSVVDALGFFQDEDARSVLLDIARKTDDPGLFTGIVRAVSRHNLPAAAALAIERLADSGDGGDPEQLLSGVLRRKGGAKLLADELASRELDSGVAKRSLRVALAAANEPTELLAAIRRAGSLGDSGWEMTGEFKTRILAAVASRGDPRLGEAVYRRNDLQCTSCHAIAGAGGRVGPDLVSIGASAPDDYLLESIIAPNAKVKENFHSTIILDVDGQVTSGIPIREDAQTLVIRTQKDEIRSIAKTEIDQRRAGRSLMPDGGVDGLTETEIIHLVRFLSVLGEPGDYAVGTREFARRWQFLENSAASRLRLRRTSYDSVVQKDPAYQWRPAYTEVSGLLPVPSVDAIPRFPDGVPVAFLRCDLQVNRKGPVGLRFNDARGLSIWIDQTPSPSRTTITADLDTGRHRVTIAVDTSIRKTAIRLELAEPSEGSGQGQWITGK